MSESSLEVRLELLRFFSANPYTIDTASGLAAKTGLPEKVLLVELERLSEIGILKKEQKETKLLFSYIRPLPPKKREN
ncbi:MAG: hypothetical protein N2234_05070 [Planctomycetota bacterium]|nr:hypothetical protein [Planctomycetota bacterium]